MLRATCVVVLIAAHWLLLVTGVRTKSQTFDEGVHLTSGYLFWTRNDFRFQPENGNLPQRWAAVPLLFMDLVPPSDSSVAYLHGSVWNVAHEFFFTKGNPHQRMLWAGRLAMSVLSVALLLTVFVWSRHLWGVPGAFLSLTLAAFSPTLLAHGALATSDMAFALAFTLACLSLWRLLNHVSIGSLLVCGLTVGMTCLAKFSAVFLAPVALGFGAKVLFAKQPMLASWPGRPPVELTNLYHKLATVVGTLILLTFIAWAMIWSAFDFRFRPTPHRLSAVSYLRSLESMNLGTAERWGIERCTQAKLFPEAYLHGFAHVLGQAKRRTSYFRGTISDRGHPMFFPVAFLAKTTLGALGLTGVLAICLVLLPRRGEPIKGVDRALAQLGWPAIICWVFALLSHLNIGHRHILPFYPLLFVFLGAAANCLTRNRQRRTVLVLFTVWHISVALFQHPHYLAYFNELFGGPDAGHWTLVDSSLDWGQDLPGLSQWLSENVDRTRPIYLSYFGTGDPASEGINAHLLLSYGTISARQDVPPLFPGIYCVSVTMLHGVYVPLTRPPGPSQITAWNDANTALRSIRESGENSGTIDQATARRSQKEWRRLLETYRALRFERLRLLLLDSEPIARIGHTILVFDVDEELLENVCPTPGISLKADWQPFLGGAPP